MTDEGIVLRLRPLLIEAENERKRHQRDPFIIVLTWVGCLACNIGVWWVLIYGVARGIDLAKGY